jgi:DNA polymerase-1
MNAPRVHLFDAHVYIFRAYHSLPSMTANDGTPCNAAYGFANTLIRFAADAAVSHAAVCFDYSMESFRNEVYPEYKANRGETPEDLEPQFDLCREIAHALGFPVFELEGWEADDLLATISRGVVRRKGDAVVITSDKDLCQLVREDGRIVCHDLAKDQIFDADAVRGKFGVDPTQIPDYLGLVGDSVDNLPGVPGVGPKGASAALRAFGRIEAMPDDPSSWADLGVRGAASLGRKISEHRELALRTKELATVRDDVPGVDPGLGDLTYPGADREAVAALFERLGWNRIFDRIERWQR